MFNCFAKHEKLHGVVAFPLCKRSSANVFIFTGIASVAIAAHVAIAHIPVIGALDWRLGSTCHFFITINTHCMPTFRGMLNKMRTLLQTDDTFVRLFKKPQIFGKRYIAISTPSTAAAKINR
jgi:hypothetical protein